MQISTVAVFVFFTCLGMGIYIGYACAAPMYFDLKYAIPLTLSYEKKRKLREGWDQGRLASRIRRASVIRGVLTGVIALFVLGFCWWAGNPLTAVAGLICYLLGVAVFLVAQMGKDDLYSRQTALRFREKYDKYVI